jgi:N-acetylneuraminic acid mutarotase/fibronectin type 3 domain-containing protein
MKRRLYSMLVVALASPLFTSPAGTHATCPEETHIVTLPYALAFDGGAGECGDSGFTTVMPDAGVAAVPKYDAAAVALTGGLLQITSTAGDPGGSGNSQQNAMAVRFDATGPVEMRATIAVPLGAVENWDNLGIWIGLDEDQHVKFVAHGGLLELALEAGGVTPSGGNILTPVSYAGLTSRLQLILRATPGAGSGGAAQVAAFYRFDGGAEQPAGTLGTVPATFFTAAMYGGVIQTNVGNASPVIAKYDVFSVTPGPDVTAPAALAAPSATPGSNQVVLSWTPASAGDLAGYRVYRSTSQPVTATGVPISGAAPLTTAAYVDSTAVNNTTYHYAVVAVDIADNVSTISPSTSATPSGGSGTPPAAPAGLSATAGPGTVTLGWNTVSGATGYHVYRATSASVPTGGTPYSGSTPLTSTAYVDGSVATGTTYHYVVTAVNAFGASPASNTATAAVTTWTSMAPLPLARYEAPGVAVNGSLYVVAGFDNVNGSVLEVTDEVHRYDPASNSWTPLASLPAPSGLPAGLSHHGVAVDRDQTIWVAGGYQGNDPGVAVGNVWKYSITGNAWSAGPSLPGPRAAGGLAVVGRTLHFFGGLSDRNTDEAEHWTLALDSPGASWVAAPDLPMARNHFGTLVADGRIYAIAGQTKHDAGVVDVARVDMFDTATNTWTQKASVPTARSHFEPGTFVRDGRLYIVGGGNVGAVQINNITEYDPLSDTWTELPPLPVALRAPLAKAIGSVLFVAGGGIVNGFTPTTTTYASVIPAGNGTWSSLAPLIPGRAEIGVTAARGKVYVIGGVSGSTLLNTVSVFDPAANAWADIAPVPGPPRDHIGAVTVDEKVYAIGGLTGWPGPSVADVYVYDPAAPGVGWVAKQSLPAARGAMGVAAINGKIYAVGGLSGNVAVNHAAVYDPLLNTWSPLPAMPTTRDHLTAQALDGKFYAIGGRDTSIAAVNAATEVFDPVSNTWSSLAPMLSARGSISSGVLGGRIYVFGADTGSSALNINEEFDPRVNAWRTVAPMPTPRSSTGGAVVSGRIFAPGGKSATGEHNLTVNEAFAISGAAIGGPSQTPFLEQGGQVVIEAESYSLTIARSGKSWTPVAAPTGLSGSALRVMPNTETQIDTGFATTAAELQYRVQFASAGTYHVWLRGNAATTSDNSVHVGLNGAAVATSDRLSLSTMNAWTWFKTTTDGPVATVIVPSAGVHTINVWMREDGFYLDRLLLTADTTQTPSGTGPAESPRVTAGNLPPVVDAGPDQAITWPAAAALAGSATDDGQPAPPSLSYAWSLVTGPGTVAFGAPTAASTSATFSVAGTYTLRLTVDDGAVTGTDTVEVSANNAAPPAFQSQGGQVVMEAENFHATIARGGKSWVPITAPAGFSGAGARQAMPNTGALIDTNFTAAATEMRFTVAFEAPGTYYVWLRGFAAGGADNALHAGVNNTFAAGADRMSLNTYGSWAWFNTTSDGPVATLAIPTAGTHTVNVWMREDGIAVDRVLLTTSASFVPTGTGPAESPRVGDAPSPPPAPTGFTASPSTSQIALAWSAATGATGYNVYRSTSSPVNSTGTPLNGATPITGTSFGDGLAVPGTTYFYVVKAVNAGGASPPSAEASATIATPPAAPTGLSATPSDATIALAWNASAGATGYNVYRDTDSDVSTSGAPLNASPLTSTSYVDAPSAGVLYHYVVTALNGAGESSGSLSASAQIDAAITCAVSPNPTALNFSSSVPGTYGGTGFGCFLPGTIEPDESGLALDGFNGKLVITSTEGDIHATDTTQQNALALRVANAGGYAVRARLNGPFLPSVAYQSGGVFLALDADNYAKATVLFAGASTLLEFGLETGGVFTSEALAFDPSTLDSSDEALDLWIVRRSDGTLEALYRQVSSLDSVPVFGPTQSAGVTSGPVAWVSSSPELHGGIIATDIGTGPSIDATFDEFALGGVVSTSDAPAPIGFTRRVLVKAGVDSAGAFGIPGFDNPTSLAFDPLGRLIASSQFGLIYVLTLDPAKLNSGDVAVTRVQVVNEIFNTPTRTCNIGGNPAQCEVVPGSPVGRRVVAVAVGPESTASEVVLYVSHSDPREGINSSAAALAVDTWSGAITRLRLQPVTGGDYAVVERQDLVTGLPRSRENHGPNGISFGPDGWMYFITGGNTNYGQPSTPFSMLPETYLSAAILRLNPAALGGQALPIDVEQASASSMSPLAGLLELFSTGYRDAYDLTWHSNGQLYTNDNAGNAGFGNTPGSSDGCATPSISPGTVPDTLHRVIAGAYAGHPNPARGECIFRDGTAYSPDLPGPSNFLPPLLAYNNGASTNGIVEYTAGTFGGALQGNLISATYAGDQNVRRVQLNPAGTGVLGEVGLGAFAQPLDVVTDGAGVIYIAEHGGDSISVLVPNEGAAACPADGTADDDGDGFSDLDEIANGTDPCSPASVPADFDGDMVGDASDPDVDNDGTGNGVDPLQFDPQNGAATAVPLAFEWNPGDAPLGRVANTGFAGVQLSASGGTDVTLINAGVAGGFMGIATSAGTAEGLANSQVNALQVGFSSALPFRVWTRLVDPFASVAPAVGHVGGIFFGPDQDQFVRLALVGQAGGEAAVQLGVEMSGAFTVLGTAPIDLDTVTNVDLLLYGNPAAQTIQAYYELNASGTRVLLGEVGGVPAAWFSDNTGTAAGTSLAGVMTSHGPAAQATFVYDFFRIDRETEFGSSASNEVVLYASTAPVAVGWNVLADSTAAGGLRLQNPNLNAPKLGGPSATPSHYFELTFNARKERPYRLWVRGKATSNSYENDSIYAQFSGSVTATGTPIYRIGTTSGSIVTIEDCISCGLAAWGWNDNSTDLSVPGSLGPAIYFEEDGPQTIRIQVREDGLGIDQVVLSSEEYLTVRPGAAKNDTTILDAVP